MKKKHMLVTKNEYDDYEVWFTDDLEDINDGCSVRGSKADIAAEVKKSMTSDSYEYSLSNAEVTAMQEALDFAAAAVLSTNGERKILEAVDGMFQYELLCKLANIMYDVATWDLDEPVTIVIED